MAIGGFRSGLNAWNYFFEEEEEGVRVLSFVSSVAFGDVLTREIFSILSSTDERERHLGFNLLRVVEEETLIKDLLNAITDERNSVKVKESSIKILRAFSSSDESLKKSAIEVLKGVIDESQIPALREASVRVLGEIGEGKPEVAEYLKTKGENKNEDDKLRLMALIQSGRNQEYFPASIEALTKWFEDIDKITNPFTDPLDIPNSFVKDLLPEKEERLSEGQLENLIRVVKEFIRLNLLDIGLKFRFSKTLISLDNNPETKKLLRTAWANPAEDMGRYVAELREESLSDDNYPAFEFLQTEIEELEKEIKDLNIPQEIILDDVKSITGGPNEFGKFEREYPNQKELLEKLKVFVGSYIEMWENIKEL